MVGKLTVLPSFIDWNIKGIDKSVHFLQIWILFRRKWHSCFLLVYIFFHIQKEEAGWLQVLIEHCFLGIYPKMLLKQVSQLVLTSLESLEAPNQTTKNDKKWTNVTHIWLVASDYAIQGTNMVHIRLESNTFRCHYDWHLCTMWPLPWPFDPICACWQHHVFQRHLVLGNYETFLNTFWTKFLNQKWQIVQEMKWAGVLFLLSFVLLTCTK